MTISLFAWKCVPQKGMLTSQLTSPPGVTLLKTGSSQRDSRWNEVVRATLTQQDLVLTGRGHLDKETPSPAGEAQGVSADL